MNINTVLRWLYMTTTALLNARDVFTRAGIHFDDFADLYKQRNFNHSASRQGSRFAASTCGITFQARIGINDFQFNEVRRSTLVIGVGQGEYFVASDATPIVEYTKNVIYLNDDDVAILKRDEMILKTIKNTPVSLSIQQVDIDIEKIEKGGFPHFMLKEIFEQVNSIYDTIRGRGQSRWEVT